MPRISPLRTDIWEASSRVCSKMSQSTGGDKTVPSIEMSLPGLKYSSDDEVVSLSLHTCSLGYCLPWPTVPATLHPDMVPLQVNCFPVTSLVSIPKSVPLSLEFGPHVMFTGSLHSF